MDIDPMDMVDQKDSDKSKQDKQKSQINTYVAISVALLATFMGICKVKDDNIVQAMQQAQANRIDDWSLYQARNLREELAKSTIAQLKLQELSQPPNTHNFYKQQIAIYQELANREYKKKEGQKKVAEDDQKNYDQLNIHDDQFDLSDAALSIAISLLALTSLSQKKWLFGVAIIPITLGVIMGLAGLLNWAIHPDVLTKLLS